MTGVTWGLYLFAFFAVAFVDYIYVKYLDAVGAKRPWTAGAIAAGLYLAGGAVTVAYIQEPGVVVAGALGALAGTGLAVRRG